MYDLRVEGALYFPHIQVPASPWFTRSLLYWDQVGTIVPQGYRAQPEELGEHTLELVRRGLVRQVFPQEAGSEFSRQFQRWLDGLSHSELKRRRARLKAGEITGVHIDKWMHYMGGVEQVMREGLVRDHLWGDWLEVESRTANEFMAALTLGLCHPEGGLSRGSGCAWIPATDDPAAFRVLLSGLEKAEPASPVERDVQLRLRGELQACEVRTSLLEQALPAPAEPVSAERIEQFRRKHDDRLPRCRRHIEALIDRTLALDEIRRLRALERVAEEVAELAAEAEAYLKEAGIRRLTRSPLIRMLKVAPPLAVPVSGVLETAQALETAGSLNSEALAYLALARAELGLDAGYRTLSGNAPLVEVFGR